jgi:hypothetical protein
MRRNTSTRDARLYIVSTEGARTEPEYIDWLKLQGWIDRTRVHVEIVSTPAEDGTSSPEYVLRRLDEARQRIGTIEGDECWLLIDVDRWRAEKLADVTQKAAQKGYRLGVSNPCFEVWLLLHFTDTLPQEPRCDAYEEALRTELGGFNKSSSNFQAYTRERVTEAITHARQRDTGGRWPQSPPGTHAYRLFETLL